MEETKFWIDKTLGGLELLRANYTRHSFSRHYHDTYVIVVQERGIEEFYCRGASHLSPAGSVAIVNPAEIHTGRAAGAQAWRYRAIYPSGRVLLEIAQQNLAITASKIEPYFPAAVVFDRNLAASLLCLHGTLETSADVLERQTVFTLTMAELISRFSENKSEIKPVGIESPAVKIIREYIEANYAGDIKLDDLAEVTNLNPFYLIRAFRKRTGLPPHEFLTQVRVERAKKLLAEGCSIADAALETGFFDQSHLSNRFKRITGITPKQFAKGQFHPIISSTCPRKIVSITE